MVKGPGYPDWDYRLFALDVPGMSTTSRFHESVVTRYRPGQPRLYLEGGDAATKKKKPGFKMLGVQVR